MKGRFRSLVLTALAVALGQDENMLMLKLSKVSFSAVLITASKTFGGGDGQGTTAVRIQAPRHPAQRHSLITDTGMTKLE